MLWRAAVTTLAAALFAVPVARAQEAAVVRVGVCNLGKAWEQMDERKVLQDRNNSDRQKLQAEAAAKKADVERINKERNDLKPDSLVYQEKTKLLMEKAIELDVWLRMKDAELARQEKDQTKMLYERIADGCKEVAEAKKLDLILIERRPELPTKQEDLDKLKPDDVKAILAQRDVLYINKNADMTDAVIGAVNAKFNNKTAAPAPTPAPTPAPAGKK
jgi:Skp family chaperone for outer membrane proteins